MQRVSVSVSRIAKVNNSRYGLKNEKDGFPAICGVVESKLKLEKINGT